ncbi:ABC transporter substrate-binding protein [Pseudohoeflea coraliihabitans]|uniref:ABC transporter substrate-binding protein n=1 Tax=Pseudohoeflea coraliihabitans TaxID=2860393 RepID=A0ABS6WJT9_9HYPH|nr:ABC transporter substrate-binding protein [Pseudohoeflea sp. DP4N28-3]MBW3096218.1 ABC transporter substrate-binding protein [Pseudohoeflea sp. DP4N28-3]
MRWKKLGIAISAVAVMALGSTHAIAQEKNIVRVHEYPGSIIHIVNWVMRSKGFCAEEGLECQPVYLASAILAMQAAKTEGVDIIVSSLDVMMQAVDKGYELEIIGPYLTNNVYSLSASSEVAATVADKSYPENIEALAGKRIGVVARGGSPEMIARALLAGAGMEQDEVFFVAVGGPATAFAALTAKQVDAIVSWDPVPALCEATKSCAVFADLSRGEGPSDLQAMNGGYVAYYAPSEYLQDNSAIADAFMRAHAQAVKWLQDPQNLSEAKQIVNEQFKLGDDVPDREAVLDQLVQRTIEGYGHNFDRKAVDGFNEFLLSYKLIDKPLAVETIVYDKAP